MSRHQRTKPLSRDRWMSVVCGAAVAVLGCGTTAGAMDVGRDLVGVLPHAPMFDAYQSIFGALGVILMVGGLLLPSRGATREALQEAVRARAIRNRLMTS